VQRNVLVVTSQPAFGELLRISLEKSGNYKVRLLQSGSEVLSAASRESFALGLLDADLKDQPIASLIQNLRLQQPEIKIIIIPSADADVQKTMANVKVDGTLPKPINLVDLIQLAERLTSESPILPSQAPSPVFAAPEGHPEVDTKWIEDRQQVQQNMFRLSLQSATTGVFLFQGDDLYAQASKMDHVIDRQIIGIFLHAWDNKSSMDLIRFFNDRLEKKKWMLYATILLRNYILVMIFPANMPLHEVRGHVIRMANGLSNASQTGEVRDDVMKFLGKLEEQVQEEQVELESMRAPMPRTQRPAGREPIDVKHPATPPSGEPPDTPINKRTMSCVLTVKAENLQLTGELAERIRHWVAEICNLHNWTLKELTIEPTHLVCMAQVEPQSEPVDLAEELQHTLSDLIFKLYPLLKNQGAIWETNAMLIHEGLPGAVEAEKNAEEKMNRKAREK
jgi:DNA-binding response OmpR family regulator